jgi:hypothetical protein
VLTKLVGIELGVIVELGEGIFVGCAVGAVVGFGTGPLVGRFDGYLDDEVLGLGVDGLHLGSRQMYFPFDAGFPVDVVSPPDLEK